MPLFRKQKREGDATPSDPILEAARKLIDTNLPMASFLAEAGTFDRPKMEAYIARSEHATSPFDPAQRRQMLAAGSLIMPRKASDGTIMDGYEIMRWQLFEVHMEGISAGLRLLKEARSLEALSYLSTVIAEIDAMQVRARP